MQVVVTKLKKIKTGKSVRENLLYINEINNYLKLNEELSNLNIHNIDSYISLLINTPDIDLSIDLKKMQVLLLNKMNCMIEEFNEACKLSSNPIKKTVSLIRKRSSKNNLLKKDLFKEVYCDGTVSQFFIDNLLILFYDAISVFPTYLFKNINDVVLVVKEDNGFSYSDCKNNLIYLAKDENKSTLILLSELVHEMTHLIEFHNKDVNKMARTFIKKRSKDVQDTISNLSLKYNKPFNSEIGEEVVYDIQGEDFYSGKIYLSKMTEVISNGIEYYLNNHICFMFLDHDYTSFLLDIFELEEKKLLDI